MSPIASMTAFARKTVESPLGSLVCELRSVNHRYLDLNLYLPDTLRNYEKILRELLQQNLSRGKVDLSIKFQTQNQTSHWEVNSALVDQLVNLSQDLENRFSNAQVNLMDLLSWPGVLNPVLPEAEDMEVILRGLVQTTLHELIEGRHREGAGIKSFMQECLSSMKKEIGLIVQRGPLVLEFQREKILNRFSELQLTIDPARLEQELLWWVQKMDITEEVQRLGAHLIEIQRVLDEGGVLGRRLDFLMQELNREANTIGSKSADSVITQADVELKVLTEQMREQVQNLE